MILRTLLFLLLAGGGLWLPSAYKRTLHPFRAQKFQIDLPFHPEWESTVSLDEETRALLQQPFSYLAKGQQSYVFLSSDQKYVLKLFRFNTCKIPIGQNLYTLYQKWKNPTARKELPAQLKAEKTFASCKLALSLVPELTGLVYIHLNPKEGLPTLCLKDRLGIPHRIDPARYRFILQKKCDPFLKTLNASKNPAKLAASFLQLLDRFEGLGLACYDPVMGRNFAFLDEQAIAIDIGNFFLNPEKAKESKDNFQKRFSACLEKIR